MSFGALERQILHPNTTLASATLLTDSVWTFHLCKKKKKEPQRLQTPISQIVTFNYKSGKKLFFCAMHSK